MKQIVAISCGLDEPKKDYSIINKRNLYLNYGLLGLCTILKDEGYDIKQFQGEYLTVRELIAEINNTEYKLNYIKYPVIISMVSFLSIKWCKELTKILKEEYGLFCIVGGKYVIDGNIEWLKDKLPYVDLFIEGAGEEKLPEALEFRNFTKNSETNHSEYYNKLDYSIVHNYKLYNPSIEVARGCGRGCSYCADASRKLSSIKNADEIINEIHFIEKTYDYESINLYFQMATFQVDKEWIESYKKRMNEFNKIIHWRCTSRVDVMDINNISALSEIGLRVIDLGLESASHQQLKCMHKTNNTKEYLQKAEEILHIAYENGIWIKLNILLTAGENLDTIEETRYWLDKNKKYIKGISSNCETIYGPNNNIMNILKTLGASYVNEHDLTENGYAHINLSKEIDYTLAKKKAKELSRIVMNANDYYDLKKYGYFPRNYKIKHFYDDLKNTDKKKLPFKT